MITFRFGGITAEVPSILSKRFSLDDGALVKRAGGQLVKGFYSPLATTGPAQFARLLLGLKTTQALVFGRAGDEKQPIYSTAAAPDADALTRTAGNFDWPAGPGVLFLDHDADTRPGAGQTDLDGFRAALVEACPALAEAPGVFGHSGSSFIFDTKTGACLKGEGGHHGHLFVVDGRDIPRAGRVLYDRLWLTGFGFAIVSKSGRVLDRGLLDPSVWRPERLVFSAGAACGPGVEQRRPAPIVLNDGAEPLDTRVALPDLGAAEAAEVARLKAEARKAVAEEAAEVRKQWAEANAERILAGQGKTVASHPEEAAKIREAYLAATEYCDLYGPFELIAEDGTRTRVDEIRANLDAWHGKRFYDPLEPDYGGSDRRIAYLCTRNARGPYLYSHGHGGRRFYLRRERVGHRLMAGERVSAIETALEALRLSGLLYERNGEIVRVTESGEVVPMGLAGVQLELDRHVRWLRKGKKADAGFVPCDCPRPVAEGVMAMRGSWGLPKLRAVATAPTMDPSTGRIIEADGYAPETGILVVCDGLDGWPGVPKHPTRDMVQAALERLWRPFRTFPFCGPIDRGVFLAAILSAVVRVLLPTCPGFAFVASTAGSGKSLLARCISILSGSVVASVMTGVQDEDEMRKRLLAAGRRGSAALVIDNINAAIGSDALCAWLTSEHLTERILGQSEDAVVRTGGLVVLTGNNMRLRGDLCRRVLVSRIEPGVEAPWRRAFDLDPAAYVRQHRLAMVADALLILRHYLNRPSVLSDKTASFEAWSDSVRRAVTGIAVDGFVDATDPVAAVERSYLEDPDTLKVTALFDAWASVFGGAAVTVQDIAKAASVGVAFAGVELENGIPPDAMDNLQAAVAEIAAEGGRREIDTRRLGSWISRHAGRIVCGRRLTKGAVRRGYGTWALEAA